MMDRRVRYMLGIITIIIIIWKRAARVYSFSFPLNQVGPLPLTEDKFVSKWKTANISKPRSWCGVWGGGECG